MILRAAYAYVTTQSGAVSGYAIATNGALKRLKGSPYEAGSDPDGVVVAPNGKFVYVANSGSNNVSGYTLDSGGSLKEVPGSPFAAGSVSQKLAVDPTSNFVYVTNYSAGNISAYAIANNGALTQLAGSPFAAGTGPLGIATCSVTAGKCIPPP